MSITALIITAQWNHLRSLNISGRAHCIPSALLGFLHAHPGIEELSLAPLIIGKRWFQKPRNPPSKPLLPQLKRLQCRAFHVVWLVEHGAGSRVTELTSVLLSKRVVMNEIFFDDPDELDENDEGDIELDQSGEDVPSPFREPFLDILKSNRLPSLTHLGVTGDSNDLEDVVAAFPHIHELTLDFWVREARLEYTSVITMKYPKPGYNNPLVSVHVFDLGKYVGSDSVVISGFPAANATLELDWPGRHPISNSIIMEIAWVDDTQLLLKEVNRNADSGSVVFFDLNSSDDKARSRGTVVRKLGKEGEEGDDGWIDNNQNIFPLPKSTQGSGSTAYLDIVPTPEGYNHIALFSLANSNTPRFLTFGEWEVSSGIKGVDAELSLVYFEAANPSSIGRHLFSVPIPTISSPDIVPPTQLTTAEPDEIAYYDTNFSPEAGFYLLSYEGPNIRVLLSFGVSRSVSS